MKEGSSPGLQLAGPGAMHVTGSLLMTKNKVAFTRLQGKPLIYGTYLTIFQVS